MHIQPIACVGREQVLHSYTSPTLLDAKPDLQLTTSYAAEVSCLVFNISCHAVLVNVSFIKNKI